MRGLQRIRSRNTSLHDGDVQHQDGADDVHKAMTTPENCIAEARPIQSDTETTGKQFARGAFHGSIGVK